MEARKEPERIIIVARKRPLHKVEVESREQDAVQLINAQSLTAMELKTKPDSSKYIEQHPFTLCRAFDQAFDNERIYKEIVRGVVESAMSGTKTVCFAYGQTGSGKTYTMIGDQQAGYFTPGLALLSINDILQKLPSSIGMWVAFYEVCGAKIYDLLNGRKALIAREDGNKNVCISGLTEKRVVAIEEAMAALGHGLSVRAVPVSGATNDPSKSHIIVQVHLKDAKGENVSKMAFVDLAGNEKTSGAPDSKYAKVDSVETSKSFLAIKECMRALGQDKSFAPARGSKLTQLLKDYFAGNCKVLFIANISPGLTNSEHTLSTLRYANELKVTHTSPHKENKKVSMISPQTNKGGVTSPSLASAMGGTEGISLISSAAYANRVAPQPFAALHESSAESKCGFPQPYLAGRREESVLRSIENCARMPLQHSGFFPTHAPHIPGIPGIPGITDLQYKCITREEEEKKRAHEAHETRVREIIKEEEEIVRCHIMQIERAPEITWREKNLVDEVSRPGSNWELYASSLDAVIVQKMEALASLRQKVSNNLMRISQEKNYMMQCSEPKKEVFQAKPAGVGLSAWAIAEQESMMITNDQESTMNN